MTHNDIYGLIITSLLGLVFIIMAVLLLLGKGSFLIAGYNTMSENEKKKYDIKALSCFIGKILLPIGIFTPSIAIGIIYDIGWIGGAYAGLVSILAVVAIIYCNTGNRFKK